MDRIWKTKKTQLKLTQTLIRKLTMKFKGTKKIQDNINTLPESGWIQCPYPEGIQGAPMIKMQISTSHQKSAESTPKSVIGLSKIKPPCYKYASIFHLQQKLCARALYLRKLLIWNLQFLLNAHFNLR